DAQAQLGVIPLEAAKKIWEKGKFDIEKIDEIEKTTKHDVIAFLTNLSEYIGDEARFIHQGMTSSDVLDTTLSIQLKKASEILLNDINKLLTALEKKAMEHKHTITIGRSHGIHAEPITFGLKLAGYYAEFKRNKERLINAKKEISTCAISGAVGTFAHIDPFVESYVSKKLNLEPEEISTQIIPRDRHAMFFSTLGVIASSVERLATEIRHLQRTEVREVEEYFAQGQKGSSAMPHKRNPVLTENLTGLARIVRSSVTPALENVTLWHERDISHSAVERMIAPDSTITLDFALNRLTSVIDNLLIYPEIMLSNLEKLGGLVHSQQVLLALTQKGASREDAYEMVQSNAMKVWEIPEATRKNVYKKLLKNDPKVKNYLDEIEIDKLFNLNQHFKHINTIFDRIFSNEKE
ncbi:adenylosuccinate lyase, partial [Alphaproteobacteria bacterium]|nr:adenylosuccinate lyase [Alphaproteobacteria bacterium]